MYEIFADDICIYSDTSPLDNVKVIQPKLSLADSAAGLLTFTLPPGNAGYDLIQRMTTDIVVKSDGTEIWAGRVLDEKEDFWKRRTLSCEGELAFLNDTIQPQAQYQESVKAFLSHLLDVHNSKVEDNRKIFIGAVTVTDGDAQDDGDYILRYTNYETTLECINEKLVKRLGGHLRIRKVNGKRYLDYLQDYPNTSTQVIRFGTNLLDFTKNFDLSEIATVIIPLGKEQEESSIEALTEYLTVKDAKDGNNTIYVGNKEAIDKYGWICRVVKWDDVTDPDILYKKAVKYLQEEQFDKLELEVSAIDLHYLTGTNYRLSLLDNVLCISKPHNLNRYFPITKIELDLQNPQNTKYSMGTNEDKSLTSSISNITETIDNRIDDASSAILNRARNNSTEILKAAQEGYIHTSLNNGHPYEQLIMDTASKATATKVWIFNTGGIGYISASDKRCRKPGYYYDNISFVYVVDKNEPSGYSIDPRLQILSGMTMDGAIVADMITVGTIDANKINVINVKADSVDAEDITGTTITGKKIKGGSIDGATYTQSGIHGTVSISDGWITAWSNIDAGSAIVLYGYSSTPEIGNSETLYGSKYMHYVGTNSGFVQCTTEEVISKASGSDERLKDQIETLNENNSKHIIEKIRPCSFVYKNEPDRLRFGIIAQELIPLLEDCKYDTNNMALVRTLSEGMYGVTYDEFIPHLINCVQDLYSEIGKLKDEIRILKGDN